MHVPSTLELALGRLFHQATLWSRAVFNEQTTGSYYNENWVECSIDMYARRAKKIFRSGSSANSRVALTTLRNELVLKKNELISHAFESINSILIQLLLRLAASCRQGGNTNEIRNRLKSFWNSISVGVGVGWGGGEWLRLTEIRSWDCSVTKTPLYLAIGSR